MPLDKMGHCLGTTDLDSSTVTLIHNQNPNARAGTSFLLGDQSSASLESLKCFYFISYLKSFPSLFYLQDSCKIQ